MLSPSTRIVGAGVVVAAVAAPTRPGSPRTTRLRSRMTTNEARAVPDDTVLAARNRSSVVLIRPSGTEPVLRVYAEGRTHEMVKALLGYGEQVAKSVV